MENCGNRVQCSKSEKPETNNYQGRQQKESVIVSGKKKRNGTVARKQGMWGVR
jgi:hypothetical protein